jgi:ADP-heptose:LPS heptosyltransferase
VASPALKKLERGIKSLAMGAALRLAGGRRLDPPDWDERAYRVLYLRYDRIGDMLMATGLLRAIATSHRTIELDVLASPSNACVLEGNPNVRGVLVFDRRRMSALPLVARELRRRRYDAVIDGMVLAPSTTTMILMLATGAPYRIGVAGRGNERFFTLPVPEAGAGATAVIQQGQTAIPFGVSPERARWHYDLFLRDDELARAETAWSVRPGSPRLLVNISAVTADRRWPAERFVMLLRSLRELEPSARVLVTGDPADGARVAEIGRQAGVEAAHVSPVREVFALVAAADGLVTPDTSLSHAAAATRTPVATLFRGDWTVQAPYGAQLVPVIGDGHTLEELPLQRAMDAMPRLLDLARRRARDRKGGDASGDAHPGAGGLPGGVGSG